MRLARLCLICCLLGALCCAPAQAKGAAPNLRVSSATSSSAGKQVRVVVRVRNSGWRAARSSKLDLIAGSARLARVSIPRLRGGRSTRRSFAAATNVLAPGRYRLKVCADATRRIAERRERDNCRRAGSLVVERPGGPGERPKPAPFTPIDFTPDQKQYVAAAGGYWLHVPSAYDATHQTPTRLFVWLHGCGGMSLWDIHNVAPAPGGNYIAVAPDGREGGCWDLVADPTRVLSVIEEVSSHFRIDPGRVVLGGYSSGGMLSYRTAFLNYGRIAGVIAEDSAPFMFSGMSQAAALAATTRRFHVVHLAHTEDSTFPIAGVRAELAALEAAGFPTELIERPGNHWDDDDPEAGTGTNHDLRMLLLPYLSADWVAPGV